jgi:hypothetical protein
MAKSWKESLLSSGLPLEFQVLKYLESKGCIANFEYSYLRPNETNVERQFSYDIDAAYIKEDHFVTFMVECKYRHPTVQWVFAPETYGGHHELSQNAFMHPMDHFVPAEFPFEGSFPRQLGPACSKGIELTPSGDNDKSITQGLNQLAFAFAPKIADAVEHQVHKLLVADIVFYHIPIIATTAELFRLRENVAIEEIKSASDIAEVTTKETCLVLNYNTGVELRRYNESVFGGLRERLGDPDLSNSLNTFTEDLSHLFGVIADHYSPGCIVILHANKDTFDHLFSYVDELLFPSDSLLGELKAQREKSEQRYKDVMQKLNAGKERRTEDLNRPSQN